MAPKSIEAHLTAGKDLRTMNHILEYPFSNDQTCKRKTNHHFKGLRTESPTLSCYRVALSVSKMQRGFFNFWMLKQISTSTLHLHFGVRVRI